jgi:uncharacterized protein YutE (UPF0331/DUF86 family)
MDRAVIERKLESLRHCLQRIEQKCPPQAQTLAADADLQDIVALNLSRAVQICVDIGAHVVVQLNVPPPDTMGQTFDLLAQAGVLTPELAARMRKAVGFRNIAVHSYEAIDWFIVHSIATRHLVDFSAYAQAVALKCLQAP